MTKNINFTDYQRQAARTLKPNRSFEDNLADYALGLSEAGELQNKLKKYLYHGHLLDKAEIKEELGDLLWYMAAIATTLDIDLTDVATENIEKLKKRYPNGYSDKDSRERVV
jgi:NTP pyrophosphatase (non-canonical NTP hydrolase)